MNSVLSVVNKKRLNHGGHGEHGGPAVETTRVLSIPPFVVSVVDGANTDKESATEFIGRALLVAALPLWAIRGKNSD